MEKRICTGCNQEKPLDSDHFTKDKYDKSGFTYRCKICRNETSRKWNLKNPDKVKEANLLNRDKRKKFYSSPEGIVCSRKAHLKRMYGITLDDFNKMLKNQGGKCAICRGTETRDKHKVMAVDHDHKTGKVRALLCFKCNSALGNFNDDPELLKKALKYLKNYESDNINGLL
jgi:hypothetical protein